MKNGKTTSSFPKVREIADRLNVTMENGEHFTAHHNPRMTTVKNLEVEIAEINAQIEELKEKAALIRKAATILTEQGKK